MSWRKRAKGQPCTVRYPLLCRKGTETTVLAHLPRLAPGVTGVAQKCPDWFGAFACVSCHDILDGRTPGLFNWNDPDDRHLARGAMKMTHQILKDTDAERAEASVLADLETLKAWLHQAEAHAEIRFLDELSAFIRNDYTLTRQRRAQIEAVLDAITEPTGEDHVEF